ncbi:hypothetical protein KY343_06515 [Candidatus Woesearchaeota archaeon]|nr:hypothetical protein [Candidatus Woesearchaeota archaeon]
MSEEDIKRTVEILKNALESKAKELYDNYGISDFCDIGDLNFTEDLLFHFKDALDGKNTYQLFSYLVARKGDINEDEISLYVAETLHHFAVKLKHDFEDIDAKYGRDISDKLNDEAEMILPAFKSNRFCRSYRSYMLGLIEFHRGLLSTQKDKFAKHLIKSAEYLEECVDDVDSSKEELWIVYGTLHDADLVPDEAKETFEKNYKAFREKFPDLMKEMAKRMAEGDQELEDLKNT